MKPVLSFLRRFRPAAEGVAAVEFALIMPMLLAIYLGGYAAGQAAATYRKLSDATVQLANLTSQYTTMQASDAQGVMAAAAQIMAPYPTSSLSEVLTIINVDANGAATVAWSQSYPVAGKGLVKGASVAMPANIAQKSTSYIFVQTSYAFTPVVGSDFIGAIPMSDQIYILPRQSATVACSTC
jgi:Flp pilus assembly protein TadG